MDKDQLPPWASGYVDDNNRHLGEKAGDGDGTEIEENSLTAGTNQLLKAAQVSLNATGNLSLITKLGRKGSKSSIAIYNVLPMEMKYMPTVLNLVAWLYAKDGPVSEEVPIRAHLKEDLVLEHQDPSGAGEMRQRQNKETSANDSTKQQLDTPTMLEAIRGEFTKQE